MRSFNRSYSSTMEAMSDWSIMHGTPKRCSATGFLMYPLDLVQSKRWSCINSSVERVSPASNLAIRVLGLVAGSRALALTGTGASHGAQNILDGVQASQRDNVQAVFLVRFFLERAELVSRFCLFSLAVNLCVPLEQLS